MEAMTMVDVVVILDPAFGERLEGIAALAPVWIADTDTNKAAYERLRRSHKHVDHREKGAITNFEVLNKSNLVKGLIDIMPAVEMHHGRAENKELVFPSGFVLRVIGVALNKDVTDALRGYGFTSFAELPDGFEASKH
jgi:hypothetical protein